MPDVDPGLLAKWLAARSVARNLPLPVPDHGGLRVDTMSESESRRYVFAQVTPGLVALGREIDDPQTLIKACATAETLTSELPQRWRVEATGSVMICDDPAATSVMPAGFRSETHAAGEVTRCIIRVDDGTHAASGYAVERDGVFIFDRIVVEPAFQRQGIGGALMTSLTRCRRNPASRFILVATPAGRGLYEKLGWSALSPYSTVSLRRA